MQISKKRIAELVAKIDVDPTDPRYWKTHFQPVEATVFEFARQASQAGLSEQLISPTVRMATYLGLSGQFERAIEAGTIAMNLALEVHGKKSEAYAAALVPLAFAVGEHDSQAKAIKLLKESLRIREALFERSSLPVAETLYYLGGSARNALKVEDSYDYFERCLEIRQTLLDEDSLDLAAALDAFGLSHYYLDREEGLDYIQRAYEIRQRVLPEDHPWLAESLNNLAMFYEKVETEFDKESMYRRCLQISEKWYGPAHTEIATHAENLGLLLHDQGRYAEAEELFRRVIDMHESLHGETAESRPLHIASLAECLIHNDKPEEAARWITEGIKLLSAQDESEAKRHLLCQFANYCSALNLEVTAIDLYRELAAKLKRSRDPGFLINVLSNLGSSLKAVDRVDEAIKSYDKALKLATKEFGPNSQQVADILLDIRSLYFDIEHHDSELQITRQYLDVAKKLHSNEPAQLAQAHRSLAASLIRCDMDSEAQQELLQALDIATQGLGSEDPVTASLLVNLGERCLYSDPAQAIEYLKQGLEVQLETQGEDSSTCYATLQSLGEAELENGDYADALITLARCAAFHFPDQRLPRLAKDGAASLELDEFQQDLLDTIERARHALAEKDDAAFESAIANLLKLLS